MISVSHPPCNSLEEKARKRTSCSRNHRSIKSLSTSFDLEILTEPSLISPPWHAFKALEPNSLKAPQASRSARSSGAANCRGTAVPRERLHHYAAVRLELFAGIFQRHALLRHRQPHEIEVAWHEIQAKPFKNI